MPKELLRRIPVKRLRPGLDPDDQTVLVHRLWMPESPGQKAGSDAETLVYETVSDGVTLQLERMEDVEGRFGPESVFEDRIGTCYVVATAFDQCCEPEAPLENRATPSGSRFAAR